MRIFGIYAQTYVADFNIGRNRFYFRNNVVFQALNRSHHQVCRN